MKGGSSSVKLGSQFDAALCLQSSSPAQFLLELVGNKWSFLILQELLRGDRRTSQLVAALPGISTKTLTSRLKDLEKNGLLKRTVYPEIPPRVEYSLTDRGKELQPVISALKEVGERWLEATCSIKAG
ncbi:MAG: winged helix-turn-helix transcriptional regulator [Actinomycetota bacterium]